MNEQELRSMVERLVLELAGKPAAGAAARPAPRQEEVSQGCLEDITQTDLRRQYLVDNPRSGQAFQDLKLKTPARLGLGRAGARYKTLSMLRMRADHAAAQDSVFSHVPDEFAVNNGFVPVQTLCQTKDEYLTRPDRGRRFDEANQAIIQKTFGQNPKIALVVGDGLSSAAIEANAVDCLQAVRAGLKAYGLEGGPVLYVKYCLEGGPVLYVKYCRVGASDHIGDLTGAEVVCMLVGERPGLVTAESMSAYLTYKPHIGIPESKRTVISNIHKGGTTAVEAGAHIAELIKTMLDKKASGIDLKG